MKIRNSLILLCTNYWCRQCHRKQPVIALGTFDLYDNKHGWLPTSEAAPPFLLSEVQATPTEIIELVRCTGVRYERGNDSTGIDTCFANWCIYCGARLEDSYLIRQPSAPFFPTTIDAARKIGLLEIPLASELEFDCKYSNGSAFLIPQYLRDFPNLLGPRTRHHPKPNDATQY